MVRLAMESVDWGILLTFGRFVKPNQKLTNFLTWRHGRSPSTDSGLVREEMEGGDRGLTENGHIT